LDPTPQYEPAAPVHSSASASPPAQKYPMWVGGWGGWVGVQGWWGGVQNKFQNEDDCQE